MTTREDAMKMAEDYGTVEGGIIVSPGKFEQEPFYILYFWDIVMNGFAEDCGNGVSLIELYADDKREFPELGNADYVVIECWDNGFVQLDTCSAAGADAIRENNPELDERISRH